MSRKRRMAAWFGTVITALYPPGFKQEFGAEMQWLIQLGLHTEAERGRLAVVSFLLREFTSLPWNLIQQHWLAWTKRRSPMTSATVPELPVRPVKDGASPGSWGAAFLAGLPHLIMGLLIAAGKAFPLDISPNGIAYLGAFLGLVVILVLVAAARAGWPLWSASWYLYGTWVGIAVVGLVIERLDLQESWRYTNAVFIGWMLVCVLAYFYLLLRNRLKGLLSIAFFLPLLGVLMLEFIPDPLEGWLALFLGVLAGVSAGWVVRQGKLVSALYSGIALNLVASLLLSYVGEYQIRDLPAVALHEPNFQNFLFTVLLYSGASLALIAVPFVVRGLLDVSRRRFGS